MVRYVTTVFVMALALGASTSLLASPPIGAVVQTWNYDPKTNSVTLKVVNTSQKDITAFNIAITETLADERVDKHEMLEDLVGKVVRAKNSKVTTHAEQNPSVSCTGTARFIRAKFMMKLSACNPVFKKSRLWWM